MGIFLRSVAATLLAAGLLSSSSLALADHAEGTAAYRKGEYERAFAIWKPLAERGERSPQFGLGVLYHLGRGVEKDLAEAHKWYSLAALRGHPHGRTQVEAAKRKMTRAQLADARRRLDAWAKSFAPHLSDGVAGPDRGSIRLVLTEKSRRRVRGVTEVCYAATATGLSPGKRYRVTFLPFAYIVEGKPEVILLDAIAPTSRGTLSRDVTPCFDRLMKGEWINVTVSSRDGTERSTAKAYPFPLEARNERAHLWLILAAPVGRCYLAFGEGFRPNETVWYTLDCGGDIAPGIVKADANGRFGMEAPHLLEVPHDGLCRWATLGSPGPIILSFAAGPQARAVQ